MCTIMCTRITAAGIMAIGMPGSGTRVAGSDGAKSDILLSKDLMKHRQFFATKWEVPLISGRKRETEIFYAIHHK
jgi:hypothetical protein